MVSVWPPTTAPVESLSPLKHTIRGWSHRIQVIFISELGSEINSWCQNLSCTSHENISLMRLAKYMEIYITELRPLYIHKGCMQSLFSLLSQTKGISTSCSWPFTMTAADGILEREEMYDPVSISYSWSKMERVLLAISHNIHWIFQNRKKIGHALYSYMFHLLHFSHLSNLFVLSWKWLSFF